MTEMQMDSGAAEEHWFQGKDLDVLIYKVNRRPLSADLSLFEPPASPIRHLYEVLLEQRRPVVSGRRYQREWRVGNLNLDEDAGTITGLIGWSRSDASLTSVWDEESKSWRERVVAADTSAVSPFVFQADRRYLGVLKHPSFREHTLNWVFTEILNRAEMARAVPLVQWAVEPVGDEREFNNWLDSVDQVVELRFTFERPNPDAEKAFEQLFERLDSLEAEKIREVITARDRQVGLDKQAVKNDPTTQGFIRAAMSAFGFVIGKAFRNGKKVQYDQRDQVLRERVDDVSPTVAGAIQDVEGAVRQASGRK